MKLLGRSHLVAFAAVTIMAVGVGAALANTQHHQPPSHGGKHGSHGAVLAGAGRSATRPRWSRTTRPRSTTRSPRRRWPSTAGPSTSSTTRRRPTASQAFIDFVKFFTTQNPQLHVDIKRVIGECNMVVTHSHITLSPSDRGSGGGRHLPSQPPGQGRRALGRHPGRAGDVGERQHDVLKPDIWLSSKTRWLTTTT